MNARVSTELSRYAIPECDRKELALVSVLHIAGAAERGELDFQGQPFAQQVFSHLLGEAIAGGFCEGAMLACHGKARAFTDRSMALAAGMVAAIGGHDAVLDIFDLYTMTTTNHGALQ